MSPYEIIMLVCFGASWPFSIHRSLSSRSTGGKSPVFLSLIILGYIAGVIHKILYNFNFVVYLYALNAVMVSVDLILYFRNKKLEKAKAVTA